MVYQRNSLDKLNDPNVARAIPLSQLVSVCGFHIVGSFHSMTMRSKATFP